MVAVSHADAEVLSAKFGRLAVCCVPNAPPPPQEDQHPVGPEVWGDAELKLLSVGRLVPQKGFDRLLQALAAPEVRALPFRCVVVGDGPERTALERAAAAAKLTERLVFLGGRPSQSALQHADVLLSGSRYEGLPLVPMEGVLAGCAAIVSPIAPHRELFGHLPDSLLPVDEAGWPRHLAAVLGDAERLRRLRDAQALLREQFGPTRFYAQYAALYNDVLTMRE